MDRAELERLDRDVLIERAEALHVPRARILTRPELVDEILLARARAEENPALFLARGFFGRARDLVARVVERGLHLPDAAERIRAAELSATKTPLPEPAVPTVTLAEMYAAQGHPSRAIDTLRRVLENEPDHAMARALLARYEAQPAPPAPFSPVAAEEAATPASDENEGSPERTLHGAQTRRSIPDVHFATARGPRERLAPVEGAETSAPVDADACVAVPVGAGALFVYWQLSDRARAFASSERAGARVTLRLLIVEPTWEGPRRSHRDIEVGTAAGDLLLRGLPKRAVLRVAVGWVTGAIFQPVAHSPALELPSDASWPVDATTLLRRTTTGTTRVAPTDGDAPLIARALELAALRVE